MLISLKKKDGAMASRWRRRRPCLILADREHTAALLDISAKGALLETGATLTLGASIALSHPEAGIIAATVDAITARGVHIAFAPTDSSVAFALAAITADMSDPVY
ncbi:hypothetical protein IC614_02710 [Allosphingosinicella flava]|uniref:PilZ domain-containing protein n=1 Tax=Allosphingosinicella flava TaxID=2771430 RepID=A0A7T2GL48_9SPHN|nr:hypothetical protein [Sphingosinicella flava]QPQ55533.1 hypothetical protein IC614_02710 [Sphingosinicella flava]